MLPTDLIVISNQGVNHGGHVGHQEGAGESRKHAEQGGEIQSYLELCSMTLSPTRSPGALCTGHIQPLIWLMYICMER
jgi:hypothetical protein